MFDVITIGGATLDVFLKCLSFGSLENNGSVNLCFPKGAKINVNEVHFSTGGGATNSATTFTRQNLKTASICQIANDMPGNKVLEVLKEESIDTRFVNILQNDTTDFSTIIWSPKAGSVILVNRGKSTLTQDSAHWNELQTKWLYVTSLEGNIPLLQHILTSINSNVKVAWNPGALELKQKDQLIPLLSKVELFILNKAEAIECIKKNDQNIPLNKLLQEIQRIGTSQKLITAGHEGAYFFDGTIWYKTSAFNVERVETTGAGDAFGSGFVTGLIKEFEIEKCLKLAASNAASVVQHAGAKTGILKENQLGEWLNKPLNIKKLSLT